MKDFWSVILQKIFEKLDKYCTKLLTIPCKIGAAPDFSKFDRGPPQAHPYKFEANPCISLREGSQEIRYYIVTYIENRNSYTL